MQKDENLICSDEEMLEAANNKGVVRTSPGCLQRHLEEESGMQFALLSVDNKNLLFCFGFLASQAHSPTRQTMLLFFAGHIKGKNLKWYRISTGS